MYISSVAQNVRASAVALNDDESWLIVRGTHTELVDGQTTVVSKFLVVDSVFGQLVGTVGQPCRGLAPATAEFIKTSDNVLIVTYPVLSKNITGIALDFLHTPEQHGQTYMGGFRGFGRLKFVPGMICCTF